MTAAQADLQAEFLEMPEGLRIDRPHVVDGAALWRIAKDSGNLDLNSSYSYLLWCRDFAGTSAVARTASTASRSPSSPATSGPSARKRFSCGRWPSTRNSADAASPPRSSTD